MTDSDQQELLEKLCNGDKSSFDLLYQTYSAQVYTLAFRMLGNKEEAQDITQETFIQVFNNIRQFKGDCQLYTWVYTIAKNLCYRALQNRKKSSFHSLEILVHSASHAAGSDYTGLEKKLLTDQVKEGCLAGLLRCLSLQQRIAFILHILLGLPVKEIAKIIEKSEGATKVLVHRARQNLKNYLCSNCSLYNAGNPCHCENLIDFSLKQGWIARPAGDVADQENTIDTRVIAQEIEGVRRIALLYRDLAEKQPPGDLQQQIKQVIQNKDWQIFQTHKV